MRQSSHLHTSIVCLLAVVLCHEATAQSVLFDNTDLVLGDGERLAHPNIVWMLAQPFRTDELNTTISSIELAIGRVGPPEGELQLSIWNESGGLPGQPVGEVGIIKDFDSSLSFVERGQPVLETTSFDVLIDLEPDTTYYLNLDLGDVVSTEGIGNSIVNGAPRSMNGTNMAGPLLNIDRGSSDWLSLASFGLGDRWLQMSVEAIPNIDRLSSQVRLDPSDSSLDIDNDGVLTDADRVVWVHNLANTYFGDANLDGEFSSSDLTAVFQASEYEDNITLNSTWAEGDWNGDGDFDSGDLIVAFHDGGYEIGPRTTVAAVPEPSSWVLLTLGVLGVSRIAKR